MKNKFPPRPAGVSLLQEDPITGPSTHRQPSKRATANFELPSSRCIRSSHHGINYSLRNTTMISTPIRRFPASSPRRVPKTFPSWNLIATPRQPFGRCDFHFCHSKIQRNIRDLTRDRINDVEEEGIQILLTSGVLVKDRGINPLVFTIRIRENTRPRRGFISLMHAERLDLYCRTLAPVKYISCPVTPRDHPFNAFTGYFLHVQL